MKNIAILLIGIYRSFSFMLYPGGACKYSPTCAEYTKQSISDLGFLKGTLSGARRILSCR